MSAKRTDMHRILELVRLHRLDTGCREVARLLAMGPNTERKFRVAVDEAGLLEGSPDELPELAKLKAAVEHTLPPALPHQQTSDAAPWLGDVEEMLKRKAGPKAIHDALKLKHGEKYTASLWSVRRLCKRLRKTGKVGQVKPEDVSIPRVTEPGEEAQVDFGYVGRIYDPGAGMPRRAWVFIMTLSHSRHMFCRVVFNQRTETWLALHIEAFEWFGSVPHIIVPDNLKAAVIRAAFGLSDDPALNRSYRELAKHYGFKIDPAPPRAPEKKGRVESSVKYAKNNFFKPRKPADIQECNEELDGWVMKIAGTRVHGTTGRVPLEVFALEDQGAMLSLPTRPYETVVWKKATVHADCQVAFERRLYPVPWRLKGKEVWIRAVPKTVEVYFDDERRATHERGKPVPEHIRDQYLPPKRSPYRYRSRSHWEQKADALGPEVGRFVREVFDSDDVLSMLRQVQAIVTHLEPFPPERREAACRRAQFYGNYRYQAVRDILRKGLDMQPLPVPIVPTGYCDDAPRFTRSIQEMLHLPLEVTDDCN